MNACRSGDPVRNWRRGRVLIAVEDYVEVALSFVIIHVPIEVTIKIVLAHAGK
ncbi:MAG: hypothetical protein ACJ8EL_13865 [Rhizomicrobium sp.]